MRRLAGDAKGVPDFVGESLLAKVLGKSLLATGWLAERNWQRSGNGYDDEYRSKRRADGCDGASRRCPERLFERLFTGSFRWLSGNTERAVRFSLSLRSGGLSALLLAAGRCGGRGRGSVPEAAQVFAERGAADKLSAMAVHGDRAALH